MLLAVSTRAVGPVTPWRVLCAALLGTLYALFRLCVEKSLAAVARVRAGLPDRHVPGGLPAGKPEKAREAVRKPCGLLADWRWEESQLALGQSSPALFLAAMVLYALFTGCRRSAREVREVRLRLEFSGGQVDVCALVDSGNRLHEPLSGLPVLLVERECLERALGRQNPDRLEAQGRPVRFRSLGTQRRAKLPACAAAAGSCKGAACSRRETSSWRPVSIRCPESIRRLPRSASSTRREVQGISRERSRGNLL